VYIFIKNLFRKSFNTLNGLGAKLTCFSLAVNLVQYTEHREILQVPPTVHGQYITL